MSEANLRKLIKQRNELDRKIEIEQTTIPDETKIKHDIGRRIREAREEKNITGVELSLNCGLNRSMNWYVESGRSWVSIKILYLFCQYLDVSADYILFGKESEK